MLKIIIENVQGYAVHVGVAMRNFTIILLYMSKPYSKDMVF